MRNLTLAAFALLALATPAQAEKLYGKNEGLPVGPPGYATAGILRGNVFDLDDSSNTAGHSIKLCWDTTTVTDTYRCDTTSTPGSGVTNMANYTVPSSTGGGYVLNDGALHTLHMIAIGTTSPNVEFDGSPYPYKIVSGVIQPMWTPASTTANSRLTAAKTFVLANAADVYSVGSSGTTICTINQYGTSTPVALKSDGVAGYYIQQRSIPCDTSHVAIINANFQSLNSGAPYANYTTGQTISGPQFDTYIKPAVQSMGSGIQGVAIAWARPFGIWTEGYSTSTTTPVSLAMVVANGGSYASQWIPTNAKNTGTSTFIVGQPTQPNPIFNVGSGADYWGTYGFRVTWQLAATSVSCSAPCNNPSTTGWAEDAPLMKSIIDNAVAATNTDPTGNTWFLNRSATARSAYSRVIPSTVFGTGLTNGKVDIEMAGTATGPAYYSGSITQTNLIYLGEGQTNPTWNGGTFVSGAGFYSNTTSTAGNIAPSDVGGQTPMTYGLMKGATLTWGFFYEPSWGVGGFQSVDGLLYNRYLTQGLTMAEAAMMSNKYPNIGYLAGDGLAAPYSLTGTSGPLVTTTTSFHERFDTSTSAASPNTWTISSGGTNTMRWHGSGEQPGFHAEADATVGTASSPWAIGTRDFTLQADIYPNSIWQKGTGNGVCLALTTAPPASMGTSDASIVMCPQAEGMYVDLRAGILQNGTSGYGGSRLGTATLFNYESFPWPQASNGGPIPYRRWTTKVVRTGSSLAFSVYTDELKDGLVPYFTQTTTIPSGHLTDNYGYVSLVTIGGNSSASQKVNVQITNIHGYAAPSGGSAHTITSIVPSGTAKTFQSGNQITITGTGFDSGATYSLQIGQAGTLQTVTPTYVSSTSMTATLPTETNGNVYQVHLIQGGIDAEYYPGILYSAGGLTKITPFEVLPTPASTSDATVQVYGSGYAAGTTMTFDGNSGTVTVIDPTHLSVVVPNGTQGSPRIIIVSSGTTLYDSNTASPKVNFGYAAHPYLQWRTSTSPTCTGACATTVPLLSDIQARWPDSAWSDYVTVAQRPVVNPLPSGPSFNDYGYLGILANNSTWLSTYKTQMLALPGGGLGGYGSLTGLVSGELNRLQFTIPPASWSAYLYNSALPIIQFYDAFFASLTPSERADYEDYILREQSYFNYTIGAADGTNTGGGTNYPNRLAVANAGAGYGAMALYSSLQQIRGYAAPSPITAPMPVSAVTGASQVSSITTRLKLWANFGFMPDGGYAEGIQYAAYGGDPYVIYGRAAQNMVALGIMGSDGGILNTNYQYMQNYFKQVWDGTMFATLNDSEPFAYAIPLLADIGSRLSQPDMTYLADYIKHKSATCAGIYAFGCNVFDAYPGNGWGTSDPDYYALIWHSSTFPSSFSGFPTLQVNASVQQAALRSDTAINTQFYMGLKGASNHEVGTSGMHHEDDTGSFVIQSRGEQFFGDPGYYAPYAVNHNMPFVDGTSVNNNAANVGTLDTTVSLNSANFRAATLDVSGAFTLDAKGAWTSTSTTYNVNESVTYSGRLYACIKYPCHVTPGTDPTSWADQGVSTVTGVSRARRNFVMYCNGARCFGSLLDDVVTDGPGAAAPVFQAFQTVGTLASSGFMMTGQSSKIATVFDGPTHTVTSAAGNPAFNAGGTGAQNSWVYSALSRTANFNPPIVQPYTTIQNAYTLSTATPMITTFAPQNLTGTDALTAVIDRSTAGTILMTISDGATMTWTQPGGTGGQWNLTGTSAPSGAVPGSFAGMRLQGVVLQ